METNNLFSTLEIKSVEDSSGKRIVRGIASTIETDRQFDQIQLANAKFKLPLPFMRQHNHDLALGTVTSLVANNKGQLEMVAEIATITEQCTLKDQCDSFYQAIKSGLIRGLSIGFRALDWTANAEGGLLYTDIEIIEVSGVSVPCNESATITQVKQYAAKEKAATKHITVSLNPEHHATKAAATRPKVATRPATGVKLGAGHGVAIGKSMGVELPQHLKKHAAKASCLSVTKRLELSYAIAANYDKPTAQAWLELTHELRGII